MSKKLTKRADDYSKWYNELVVKADLAENSAVRGCMVIKPYGYAIWEKMQAELDRMFKETGHENAYFPLFVPKSLFEAEEKNAEGFAKECAVVTHYRLQNDPDRPGKLRVDPDAKLEEELVVRPTSEAIIWNTYKGWIQSYQRFTITNQPVGQCGSLGNANPFVFKNCRVFVARRAYSTRNRNRGNHRGKTNARSLCNFC